VCKQHPVHHARDGGVDARVQRLWFALGLDQRVLVHQLLHVDPCKPDDLEHRHRGREDEAERDVVQELTLAFVEQQFGPGLLFVQVVLRGEAATRETDQQLAHAALGDHLEELADVRNQKVHEDVRDHLLTHQLLPHLVHVHGLLGEEVRQLGPVLNLESGALEEPLEVPSDEDWQQRQVDEVGECQLEGEVRNH